MPDLTPTTSETLLRRLASNPGSPRDEEFARLYEPVLRRYVAQCPAGGEPLQPADRDDLVQEIYLSVHSALAGFRYDPARGRFRAYLRRVVRNLVLRRTEERERDAAFAAECAAAGDAGAPDEADSLRFRVWTLALARVLDSGRFSPNTAAAFRRFAIDGVPAESVGAEFGMRPNAVYQLKNRVLGAVRDELRRAGHGRLSLGDLCDALECH